MHICIPYSLPFTPRLWPCAIPASYSLALSFSHSCALSFSEAVHYPFQKLCTILFIQLCTVLFHALGHAPLLPAPYSAAVALRYSLRNLVLVFSVIPVVMCLAYSSFIFLPLVCPNNDLPVPSAVIPASPPSLLQCARGPVHAVPSAAQSWQLDPNEVIVPAQIIHILHAGWTDHIPLDAITNRACRLATSQLTCSSEHGLTMGSDGRIITKVTPLDHLKEDKIDISNWYQSSQNLVFAIHHFLWAAGDNAPGGANAWEISKLFNCHFTLLQNHTNFEESFPAYHQYDITVQ